MNDSVVHDESDIVGVAVLEGVKAGNEITGWIMDQDREIEFTAASDIPIGHKLAINPLKKGDMVIKYRVDMGKVVVDIGLGELHKYRTSRPSDGRDGLEQRVVYKHEERAMSQDLSNTTFSSY